MSRVYAAKCDSLGAGISEILNLIELGDIGGKVIVKVNFVSAYEPLCATPVEAVEELVKFLSSRCRIIIAEAPTIGRFKDAVRRYGYERLLEYGVEFFDLSEDDYEDFYVWGRNLKRDIKVKVSRTILQCDWLVSLVRPKTHDAVIVTLTVKNVAVGALEPGSRHKIHQGYKAMNINLAYLATRLMPKLSLIDGYVGMQGAGPTRGAPCILGVSLGGRNAVSVDAMAATIIGFNPFDIGYLYYISKWGYGSIGPNDIKVVGLQDWRLYAKSFQPHPNFQRQLEWRLRSDELVKVEEELVDEGVIREAP
ncbi:MAG: DUF362 domain-containing protein [Thermofilaceae archaeon]